MLPALALRLVLAGQHPTGGAGETVAAAAKGAGDQWMWIVAVTTLAGVVSLLFGILMKNVRDQRASVEDHAKTIQKIHDDYRAADEARSKRTAEEFQKKDANLFEWATKASAVMERVANEIAKLNDNSDVSSIKTDLATVKADMAEVKLAVRRRD